MFEPQNSGSKTSLGRIGFNIRTHESQKLEQDQVSGGVRVLYLLATPVATVVW